MSNFSTISGKLQRDLIKSYEAAYLEFESEPWMTRSYKDWLRDVYVIRNPEHVDLLSLSTKSLGWWFRSEGPKWSKFGFRVIKYEDGHSGAKWRLEKEDVAPPEIPVSDTIDLELVRMVAKSGGADWTFNINSKIHTGGLMVEILDELVDKGVFAYSHDGNRVHLVMEKHLLDRRLPDPLRRLYPDDTTIQAIRLELGMSREVLASPYPHGELIPYPAENQR